ncbi:MAG: GNAT family N-acetyltransferase [Gaiellaceae bacterium]
MAAGDALRAELVRNDCGVEAQHGVRPERKNQRVGSDTHVHIREARPDEGELLREIAIASKGHWGYDPEVVRGWAAGGDFTAEGLARKAVHVAEVNGRVVGWAGLIPRGDVCWLDDLWIEPSAIGTGIGSRLFRHAAQVAEELGASRMEWEAEPNALGFYERMGGRYLRDSEPSEWGRVLKVMGVDLVSSPHRCV